MKSTFIPFNSGGGQHIDASSGNKSHKYLTSHSTDHSPSSNHNLHPSHHHHYQNHDLHPISKEGHNTHSFDENISCQINRNLKHSASNHTSDHKRTSHVRYKDPTLEEVRFTNACNRNMNNHRSQPSANITEDYSNISFKRLHDPLDDNNSNANYRSKNHRNRNLQKTPSFDPGTSRPKPSLQYPYYSSLHEPDIQNMNEHFIEHHENFVNGNAVSEKLNEFAGAPEMSQSNLEHQHHLLHHHQPQHQQIPDRSSPSIITANHSDTSQPGTSTGALTGSEYAVYCNKKKTMK